MNKIKKTRIAFVDGLASYFDKRKDHVHSRGSTARGEPVPSCFLHHEAVMKCQRVLVRSKAWPVGWMEKKKMSDFIQTIHHMLAQLSYAGEEVDLKCDVVQGVVRYFEQGVQKLKNVVEDTYAGVCLPCFRAGRDAKFCEHEHHLATCQWCEKVVGNGSPLH